MSHMIGIDLGGTRIKAGAWNEAGQLLAETTDWTRDGEWIDGEPAFVSGVRSAIRHLEEKVDGRLRGVGICAPGLASQDHRRIWHMPERLNGIEEIDWTETFPEQSCRVLNDAQAALLGECWLGAGRGLKHIAMLTFGTGVGGAILADGRILKGAIGRAGCLGHLSLRSGGQPGIVGLPGTIEETLSNSAVAKVADGRWPDLKTLFDQKKAGQREAVAHWHWAIDEIARGIASLINIIDPKAIILGGGLAAAGEHLLTDMQQALDRYEWRPDGSQVALRLAELGSSAGAAGAAYSILQSDPSTDQNNYDH